MHRHGKAQMIGTNAEVSASELLLKQLHAAAFDSAPGAGLPSATSFSEEIHALAEQYGFSAAFVQLVAKLVPAEPGRADWAYMFMVFSNLSLRRDASRLLSRTAELASRWAHTLWSADLVGLREAVTNETLRKAGDDVSCLHRDVSLGSAVDHTKWRKLRKVLIGATPTDSVEAQAALAMGAGAWNLEETPLAIGELCAACESFTTACADRDFSWNPSDERPAIVENANALQSLMHAISFISTSGVPEDTRKSTIAHLDTLLTKTREGPDPTQRRAHDLRVARASAVSSMTQRARASLLGLVCLPYVELRASERLT
jgi:hypothetical protein